MPDQPMILQLEIPPDVLQQDIWNFETELNHIAGITTDVQEPKNLLSTTLLFIQIAAPYVGQAVTIAGGVSTFHDLAQSIFTFLHPKKQSAKQVHGKNKVVIIAKGKRIELYNLSPEQIEKIITQ